MKLYTLYVTLERNNALTYRVRLLTEKQNDAGDISMEVDDYLNLNSFICGGKMKDVDVLRLEQRES